MLLRRLFGSLFLAAAAAVASAQLPTCPGVAIAIQGPRKDLTPGKRIVLTIGVKNSGTSVLHSFGWSLTSYAATNWQAKGKLSAPTVDGATVSWLDQPLGPNKKRRHKIRGQVCQVPGDIVAGQPQTIAELSLFRVDKDGDPVCMTSAAPLTVGGSGSRTGWD